MHINLKYIITATITDSSGKALGTFSGGKVATFTPTTAGTYKITYKFTYAGKQYTKERTITVTN